MGGARRPRSSKWSVRNPRARTPWANPDHASPAPPHLQFVSRRVDSPTPLRERDESSLGADGDDLLSAAAFDSQLGDLESFPSLPMRPNTVDYSKMSELVLQGGQYPRSQGGVSLDDFIKPNTRQRGSRQAKQTESNTNLDATQIQNYASNASVQPGQQEPPLTARRISQAVEPKTPARPSHQFAQAHATTDPALHYRVANAMKPLPTAQASHGEVAAMDDGKGGKIVCQFNDPFNKGAEFGQWCPVGIIRQHNVKDYEAFEQSYQRNHSEGTYTVEEHQAHKAHALQQMLEDGQLEPITSSEGLMLPMTSSAPGQGPPKVAPPPGLHPTMRDVAQDRMSNSGIGHQPTNNTPTKPSYDPFATPLGPASSASRQPHDPFVSPYYPRHQQDITMTRAAADTQKWQEQQSRRTQVLQDQRQAALQSLAAKRNNFIFRRESEQQVNKPRTVLHDPFLERGETARNPLIQAEVVEVNPEHAAQIAQPQPRYNAGVSTSLKIQDFWSLKSDTTKTSPAAPVDSFDDAKQQHDLGLAFEGMSCMDPSTPFPYSSDIPPQTEEFKRNDQPPSHPFLQQPDIRRFLDPDKTEEELRNPFGKQRQTFQPPFFADEPPKDASDRAESPDSKFNRIWYSGLNDFNRKMGAASNAATGQGGPNNDSDPFLTSLLAGPVFENMKWYKDHPEKKRSPWSVSTDGPWPYNTTHHSENVDYFARQYNTQAAKVEGGKKVSSWLDEVKGE